MLIALGDFIFIKSYWVEIDIHKSVENIMLTRVYICDIDHIEVLDLVAACHKGFY